MNGIPTPIILEVEGVLEDVLTEVFHKRVYPMLNAAPAGAVRLVVTTQPDLFQGGQEGGESFFNQGGPDRETAFTWKRSGSLSEVVQQFRTEFLGTLSARALDRHVLFGIYNADFKPVPPPEAETEPQTEPSLAEPNASEHDVTTATPAQPEDALIVHDDEKKEGGTESADEDAGEEMPWWEDSLAADAPPVEHAPVEPTDPGAAEDADIADIIEFPSTPAPVEPAAEDADIADIIESPSAPEPSETPRPAYVADTADSITAPPTGPAETGGQGAETALAPADVEPMPEPIETAPAAEEAAETASAELAAGEAPPAETNAPTEAFESVEPAQATEPPPPAAAEPEQFLCAEPLLLAPSRSRALGGDYLEFFSLTTPPFAGELETAQLFSTPRRQEILAELLEAVTKAPGGALATGPRGCGLTTLGHELRRRLPEQFQSAAVGATALMTPTQLLRAIATSLGCETEGFGRAALLECVMRLSRDWQGAGGGVCILIEDAERLEPDALEALLQLVVPGHEKEPSEAAAPPRLILLGRPELRKSVSRRELRGLRAHLAIERKLPAFTRAETGQYIQHRLALASPQNPLRFTRGAMRAAWRYSGGAPGVINELCDRALRAACADRERRITRGRIRKAARALELRPQGGPLARFFEFW